MQYSENPGNSITLPLSFSFMLPVSRSESATPLKSIKLVYSKQQTTQAQQLLELAMKNGIDASLCPISSRADIYSLRAEIEAKEETIKSINGQLKELRKHYEQVLETFKDKLSTIDQAFKTEEKQNTF